MRRSTHVVPIVQDLTDRGLEVTLDVVGEDITTPEQAAAARDAYLELVERLGELELGTRAEMSVKLSLFGQALPGGHELALANIRPVVEAAAAIGTTVTLDAEDHTTLDSMFAIHEELRKDFPQTGCVIQAYLFRTEADARRLADSGSRVRLVKGAYKEPAEVAYQQQVRDRQGVRPHPEDPDGGRGVPDDRVPRPAPHLHRPGTRPAREPQARRVRVPDAVRHPRATSICGSPPRDTGCASTPPTARTGTGTSCGAWRRSRPTCCFFGRSILTKG